MNSHFIIYISIIIICIILFLIYFNIYVNTKKDKKNNKENFFPWDFDKNSENKPVFVKNYENINFTQPPNYKNENITEYNFNRLFKYVERVNKEIIYLKDRGNYNFYTQSTTDYKLKMDLDMVSKYVTSILNKDGYYDFEKTNYGDVEMWVDKDGNEEIKYELFLWDKKNYFQLKLLVNIIKFIEKGQVTHYGVKDHDYIFPDYNIGLPFKDQIIPLPTDVIITAHEDTSLASIKPNEPTKIKYLYLNQISIQNSTLIVDYQKDKYPFKRYEVSDEGSYGGEKLENVFSGITDMSLEYIKIKGGGTHDPYVESGRKYNEWPTLDEQPKWKAQYPSKPPPQHWNVDSVYYYGEDDEKEFSDPRICDVYSPGTRWSKDKEELQPYYWPTLATIPRNCGDNNWLFELANGTEGTFFGGGKM
jgi:hypothetical protein